MADDITLGMVLEHSQLTMREMHHLHSETMKALGQLKSSLEGRFDRLEHRVDRLDINLTLQIDALDKRLDTTEITMVEQNHEGRIRKLEKHAGFANAA